MKLKEVITINNSEAVNALDNAYAKAKEITKSVLTLARVLGVKPKVLAEAIRAGNDNATYNAEFTAELIKSFTAEAVEASEKKSD